MNERIACSMRLLKTDIDSLTNELNLMKSKAIEVFNEIDSLNAMWSGPAHETVNKGFIEDRNFIEFVIADMKNYIEEFEYAYEQYTACEQNVNEFINSID